MTIMMIMIMMVMIILNDDNDYQWLSSWPCDRGNDGVKGISQPVQVSIEHVSPTWSKWRNKLINQSINLLSWMRRMRIANASFHQSKPLAATQRRNRHSTCSARRLWLALHSFVKLAGHQLAMCLVPESSVIMTKQCQVREESWPSQTNFSFCRNVRYY